MANRRRDVVTRLRFVAVTWIAFLCAACSAESEPADQFIRDRLADGTLVSRTTALEPDSISTEETFVSGPDGIQFGRIMALEVDDYDRVYVADRLNSSVQVLGLEGKPVRTLGRPGDGPGELRNPIGLAFDPAGNLWIVDVGRGRYVVYDTTGSFVGEWPRQITGWGWPWDGGFDDRGNLCDVGIIAGPEPAEAAFCGRVVADSLVPVDTLPVPPLERTVIEIRAPEGRFTVALPHSRQREARITGGRLWVGFTDRYRLATADAVTPPRAVVRDVSPTPLTPEERSAIVDSLAELGADRGEVEERLGHRRATFETFSADAEGRLWVVRKDSADRVSIDAFDPEGFLVGSLAVALDPLPRIVARNGSIWGVRSDALGVQSVVRLRITSIPSTPAP